MISRIVCLFISICLLPSLSHADQIETPCATQIYASKLAQTVSTVEESDDEEVIKQWIYSIFTNKDTVSDILKCPELNISDNATIKFTPIKYVFPMGREVVINYETQPKILKQRLALADKRDLPPYDANPRIGEMGDGTIWTNTDPAWYAIMVVESGALNNFVGEHKNNTISVQYIHDNIDALYPKNRGCTTKHALARDSKPINRAVKQAVDIENDSNDYYVAGDANLAWIGYAEIAMDVAITVATMGGGVLISGATKSARASRALKGMATSLKQLRNLDSVRDYIKYTARAAQLTDEIKKLDKVTDAAKIAEKTAELDKLKDAIKGLESIDDVKKYKQTSETFSDLNKYRRTLNGIKALKQAQRGNIIARGVKVAKSANAAMSGNKLIAKGAKLGRASKVSTRVNDWLFHSTLKNIGMLGKMETFGGAIYGGIQFIGGMMYDFTETSTGEFTNDIQFQPLLLLSADDLQGGQADKINYGMWLMWSGDSTNPADDDAAYLQAMDFAAKFHEDLMEVQNNTNSPCNVDIYVAKPIIRNPGSANPELYYLIMNDTPWTTK